MSNPFQKASRKNTKLKLGISGPAGAGKTFSALRLATGLTNGGKIAFIDTENGSASLYSDRFAFDVVEISPPFTDAKFISAINAAVDGGYEAVIIDSASHCWEGVLEMKARLDARAGSNSYTNWNEAGKNFKGIMDAVLHSPIHVIACMRSKMDYVLETNDRGKQQPRKVGLAPIMRDGIEYDFSTVFDVDMSHQCKTSKDRSGLFLDQVFQITEDTGKQLIAWMASGAPPVVADPPTIAGKNPDIAKPVNASWSDEQKTEAGSYRAEIEKYPGGGDRFNKLWAMSKKNPASQVIDSLAELLRELRGIESEVDSPK